MFISNMDKARVLTQALPYIQKYTGKTVVVKYGGSAMHNPGLNEAVISDLVLLSLVGIHVVLVHGGGPEINNMMSKLGKESRFVNGLRYTDDEDIEIVQMVLAGKTNKDLVNLIGRIGGRAVGLCGIDGGMIKAKKLEDGINDYGNVGDITSIDVSVIRDNLERGYIPVVSTIAAGVDDGMVYNINADIAAARLAVALQASNLLLLTDVRGVLRDPKDEASLIPVVKISDIPALIAEGIITGGMIPKVNCCAEAISQGISRTCILDGRILHSILIEMFSDEGIGTMFVK
jgi:acetylglutamate kinase